VLNKRVSVADAGQTLCLLSASALCSPPRQKKMVKKKVAKKEENVKTNSHSHAGHTARTRQAAGLGLKKKTRTENPKLV